MELSQAGDTSRAVLVLLLSLLQTVPERRALLARLRTMGLARAKYIQALGTEHRVMLELEQDHIEIHRS